MDAQNAVEPISTKPPASPKGLGSGPDPTSPSIATKPLGSAKQSPSTKHAKPVITAPSTDAHGGGGGGDADDAATAEGNSDAETIVLPGKDGHSPSKVRKIKNEDKSDGADHGDSTSASALGRKPPNNKHDRGADRGDRSDKADKASVSSANWPSDATHSTFGGQRKKSHDNNKPRSKDGSSGLSSVPTSPPPHSRRRSSHPPSDSDSEPSTSKSPKTSTKEKPRIDKLVPHKRKATRAESEDEAEGRKVRRQRTSGSGLNASRSHRDPNPSAKPHHDSHPGLVNKSVSPPPRPHRRSASTQLPGHSSNGLSHKKKRVPAPLRSTDYHSDESSASGSPHPRSSKLRSLTTPATTESTTSPAKMAPHKKHLDAHGQTFLARACARGEYDVAKHRLGERPEDIDVADYAGNTPLQIASINGCEDIVKLLIEAGCSLDCVNYDKDTPLLDAVDNGHLEVVKLLLAAGVNPRKANAYGQEPIDRVPDDEENAAEMRKALQEARARMGERRRTSEDHHPQDHTDARSSHGPESPRQSPGAALLTPAGASSRRAGTVRSTKTSNHLLYMPMDDKTLRSAAARGDEETVTRILQVRDTFDDPESMVAAARGGHDIVMQLLLALGRANPDPGPISNNEFSTPMLAAIGQENLKVVRLLLDQTDFDPTRRFKGEAYHEVARRRRGPNWMDEEHMLKNAYDEHRRLHKDSSKTKSPNRREQEREARRHRTEPKEDGPGPVPHKKKASSPAKEGAREGKKAGLAKASTTSPKENRRSSSFANQQDDQSSPKRGPGRPRKEDRIPAIAISDREASPATSKLPNKPRRTESDVAVSSEGETMKPRRKLVSRRELKGEREKRRASMTSNASSMKEPSSPRESKHDEPHEKHQKLDKYHDRTKALKRDESRDKLSVSGDTPGKRHRLSATPPRLGSDKDGSEAPVKRRRLEVVEPKEKRQKTSPSPDERPPKSTSTRDAASSSRSGSKSRQKDRVGSERRASSKPRKSESAHEHGKKEPGKATSDKSIHVKSEEADVDMLDAPKATESGPDRALQEKEKEEARQRQAELEAQTKKKEEERERKRKEDEEKEKERVRRRKEEEETARRAEEEKRQREEAERKLKEEEERKLKEEEERKQREEEERKRLEEEAKRKREEEERRQREEEERKKREEEERLRQEQLEREAAEEARRKKDEERKEQERKERAMREEMERRRAAREAERAAKEAEQRRIRLEQERIRLAKLPPLLRWLDGSPNPKAPEVAAKFSMMQGVRYDCIQPAATGTPDGREQWLLNTQVALLLGEKDLELSRCKCTFLRSLRGQSILTICRYCLGARRRIQYCEAHHLETRIGPLRSDDPEPLRSWAPASRLLRRREP